jgi:thiol-disulfide isomerase/thioredoxin
VSPQRWGLLVLVLLALGLSLAYGVTKGSGPAKAPTSAAVERLQSAAALDPCPEGLGPAFPKKKLPCLGGGPDVALTSSAVGVPTLVNVYGSWCGPCLREMPILREWHAGAGKAVALVGVDSQDDFSNALRFAKDVGQTWPAVYDNDKLVVSTLALATPSTLFLDPSGKVVYVHRGELKSVTQLRDLVRAHLGVQP